LADDPDSSWLEEVHSKIWDKRELESELFRTVKVTQAHYTVQSVKLDFLRSITTLSPQVDNGDGSGASNEDGPEISLFFPFNLSYFLLVDYYSLVTMTSNNNEYPSISRPPPLLVYSPLIHPMC
jgi:hypothetical protein